MIFSFMDQNSMHEIIYKLPVKMSGALKHKKRKFLIFMDGNIIFMKLKIK